MYMSVMLIGLPAFMISQIYSSTLRECGLTMIPMASGVIAIIANLAFNYVFIFGKMGVPAMGVVGAAMATVIARYIEAFIVVTWTHVHSAQCIYIQGVYRSMYIPSSLAKIILRKGLPLLLNETLWASGMAMLTQCYSMRGLSVIAGFNISNTIYNLFNIVFIALGDSVAIIVGQLLGAGKMKQAKDTARKMIVFSALCSLGIGIIMFFTAPIFPSLYNTDEYTKHLATYFIMICAVFLPQSAFLHSTYFTLRSGGKTVITFLFDSVFMWIVCVPIAYVLSRYTGVHITVIMISVMLCDFIKCVIGYVLVKKGVWLNNIVNKE